MGGTRTIARDAPPQAIRFCRGADGVRLAWAEHGSGPPLVVVSCWLSHLQHDWRSPVWRHFLDDVGELSTLVRYDERGFGLSDWTVADFSLEARLHDLEAIVAATGYERFSLLGMSGGSPVALAYAAEHPDRVDRLILYGANAVGSYDRVPSDPELAFRAMIRAGWAQEGSEFRRFFTNRFIPGATEEQLGWFDELQRMSTSTENAVESRVARWRVNVTDRLPRIRAATLVLHAEGDQAAPVSAGRTLATSIPNARLVVLESRNHILLDDEPAWRVFMSEVTAFMAGAENHRAADDLAHRMAQLSVREREVLHLAADGRTNSQIAEALVLSVRTVERHLSNAYVKMGFSGQAARAAAVATLLRHESA